MLEITWAYHLLILVFGVIDGIEILFPVVRFFRSCSISVIVLYLHLI